MSRNMFATSMVGTKRGQAWKAMIAKKDGICSCCKKVISEGDRIVIKQVGKSLNARHEACRDKIPAPVVTQVDENVYRVKRAESQDGARTRSFDPAALVKG